MRMAVGRHCLVASIGAHGYRCLVGTQGHHPPAHGQERPPSGVPPRRICALMSELSTIGRHAITVLAGQLAVMAFGVTDTMVAGRHGEASLAALSVGSAIFISVYVALIGVLQAL